MTNRLLLTGAGFSANFGAPIASEMSDLIFNNPLLDNNIQLKELLTENFDYELIYQKVMHEHSFNLEEKRAFTDTLCQAYKQLDENIIRYPVLNQTYGDFFKTFLFKFSTPYGGSGYIFTLNQDLLIERRFQYYPDPSLSSITLPLVDSKMFAKPWDESLDAKYQLYIPDGLLKRTTAPLWSLDM